MFLFFLADVIYYISHAKMPSYLCTKNYAKVKREKLKGLKLFICSNVEIKKNLILNLSF